MVRMVYHPYSVAEKADNWDNLPTDLTCGTRRWSPVGRMDVVSQTQAYFAVTDTIPQWAYACVCVCV